MKFGKKRGITFFLIISIMSVLMILIGSLLYFMFNEGKLVSNYIESTVALYIAESGLEQALYEIQADLYKVKKYGWNKMFDESDKGSDIPLQTFDDIAKKIKIEIPGGSLRDVRVSYELFLFMTQKFGKLTIMAEGEYRGTSKKIEITKSFYGLDGHDDGGLVPALWKTLFILNPQYFKHFGLDSDFIVHGERVYMRESTIDLGDQLVDKLCRFIDMGYGLFGGGVDLTDVDVLEGRISKKYKKFEWKKAFGIIPYPYWSPVVEDYKDNIHAGVVIDKIPNLKTDSEYQRVATKKYGDPQKKSVGYEGFSILGQGFAPTTYKNVVEFNGWGSWQNIPTKWYQFWKNPTKADDASTPIELNGIQYVDGDVMVEGYYKGNGAIVSSGNIYISGDLMKWGASPEVRKKSGLALISVNGEVIYKPHHDKDWSRYPAIFKNLNPYMEASITAPQGFRMEGGKGAFVQKLMDLTIKGNLVVNNLDLKKLPYDVKIVEDTDLRDLQEPWKGEDGITHKYFMKETIISWLEYR